LWSSENGSENGSENEIVMNVKEMEKNRMDENRVELMRRRWMRIG
jgi:hypothetical protein